MWLMFSVGGCAFSPRTLGGFSPHTGIRALVRSPLQTSYRPDQLSVYTLQYTAICRARHTVHYQRQVMARTHQGNLWPVVLAHPMLSGRRPSLSLQSLLVVVIRPFKGTSLQTTPDSGSQLTKMKQSVSWVSVSLRPLSFLKPLVLTRPGLSLGLSLTISSLQPPMPKAIFSILIICLYDL